MLQVSGGGLSSSKCVYYHTKWDHNNIGTNSRINKISIQSISQKIKIEQSPNNQSNRYLGIQMCPKYNLKDEQSVIQEQAEDLAARIKSSNLSSYEIYTIYRTTWLAQICFYACHTQLNVNEYHEIQQSVINVIISKMGYNWHTPRAIVFGSKSLGGIGLKYLYHEQGCHSKYELLFRLRHPQKCNEVLHISLEWTQFECGRENDSLKHHTSPTSESQTHGKPTYGDTSLRKISSSSTLIS